MASIRSAAILIIGDEILNAKIRDSNLHFFARLCFERGIGVKRISVVGDDEEEIASEIQSLTSKCDLVVTSGGIGPTHDDITYPALAKAFGLDCRLDEETALRMRALRKDAFARLQGPQVEAMYRMATFPAGPEVLKTYVSEKLWVPVVGIRQQVYVLPGVPQLFEQLLVGLFDLVLARLPDLLARQYLRFFVKTRMGELEIAPYLEQQQQKWNDRLATLPPADRIKIGLYPHMGLGINTVSIIGLKEHEAALREIVAGMVEHVKGEEISAAEEDELSGNVDDVKL